MPLLTRYLCSASEPWRKQPGANTIVTKLPLKVFPSPKAFGPIVP
jgi:hypothetical protein